jgi:membrane fusion protein (multidrug efflux system)
MVNGRYPKELVMSQLSKLSLIVLLMAASACSDQASTSKGPPGFDPNAAVEVGVVTLKAQSVARFTELPGRAASYATAEIRPQVDGIVRERFFKEGGPVKAGDTLFMLDDAKFRATYAAAAAVVQKAEASLQGANDTLARNEALARSNAVSTQVLQDAKTAQLQANADVESAKAALATARINLDDATITAPIPGIIGKSSVSVGALVTANQTDALATIRQVDPIYVDLVDSSANLLRIRDLVRAGKLARLYDTPPKVTFTLENGETYEKQGEMSLFDIVVSETTGTFSLRATVANPDRVLCRACSCVPALILVSCPVPSWCRNALSAAMLQARQPPFSSARMAGRNSACWRRTALPEMIGSFPRV